MTRLQRALIGAIVIGAGASCTNDSMPAAPIPGHLLSTTQPTTDVLIAGVTYSSSGQFVSFSSCELTVRDTVADSISAKTDTFPPVVVTSYQPTNNTGCTEVQSLNGGTVDLIEQLGSSSAIYRQSANILLTGRQINIPTDATITLEADLSSGYSFLDWRIYQGDSVVISNDPVLHVTGASLAPTYYLELIQSPPPPPPPDSGGGSTCIDPTQPGCS